MTEAPPVTLDSLIADLRKLGLEEGDAVVMRCATRAIAPSAKGMASVLLDALLQTVGPAGTVVGPTHTALQKASEKRPVTVFSDDAPTTAGGFGAAILRQEKTGKTRRGPQPPALACLASRRLDRCWRKLDRAAVLHRSSARQRHFCDSQEQEGGRCDRHGDLRGA
jgi:hypothetical protein